MIEIIPTADGSYTLKHHELDENYHSDRGAYTESMHVFVQEGLLNYAENHPDQNKIAILEIGFGTGLNAILSWQQAQGKSFSIHYDTLEPYPISMEIIAQTHYADLLDSEQAKQQFQAMHQATWNEPCTIDQSFILHKMHTRLEVFAPQEDLYDVIYFDAFAPKKQPELWLASSLERCYRGLKQGGILTTYCAQGQFKRDLRSLGFETQRVPGPPNGKREMTRAWKK
jgi:tRNA U34 5-methylaminomethyl-2-thiouridine-forming methyltransferase MnmC